MNHRNAEPLKNHVSEVKRWTHIRRLQTPLSSRMTDDPDELAELEIFFRSPWYGVLTSLDPELLISRLRKEKKSYDG